MKSDHVIRCIFLLATTISALDLQYGHQYHNNKITDTDGNTFITASDGRAYYHIGEIHLETQSTATVRGGNLYLDSHSDILLKESSVLNISSRSSFLTLTKLTDVMLDGRCQLHVTPGGTLNAMSSHILLTEESQVRIGGVCHISKNSFLKVEQNSQLLLSYGEIRNEGKRIALLNHATLQMSGSRLYLNKEASLSVTGSSQREKSWLKLVSTTAIFMKLAFVHLQPGVRIQILRVKRLIFATCGSIIKIPRISKRTAKVNDHDFCIVTGGENYFSKQHNTRDPNLAAIWFCGQDNDLFRQNLAAKLAKCTKEMVSDILAALNTSVSLDQSGVIPKLNPDVVMPQVTANLAPRSYAPFIAHWPSLLFWYLTQIIIILP